MRKTSDKFNKIAGGIIIILIIAFSIKAFINKPKKGIVDGVYSNECCSNIVIKEPNITYGNDKFNIRIAEMKYGLVGIVSGKFTPTGIEKSKEDAWISFSEEDGKRAIDVPIGDSFYSFKSDIRPKLAK